MNYQKQAEDFLKETGTTFKAEYLEHALYFSDDKEARDIWKITLKRNGKRWAFRFGQSFNASITNTPPRAYDVLAAITKQDPGTLEEFVSEFGYDRNPQGRRVYRAVKKEWENVQKMFEDVLEKLQEIN